MSSRSPSRIAHWVAPFALALAGCSSPATKGQLIVAITVDWEGAYLSDEGLAAMDELRDQLGRPPLTHFVAASYFTSPSREPDAASRIAGAIRDGDELAMHLHGWRSLALASGIVPKTSPSFLTGTDKLIAFEDGDIGIDTDLDVYSVVELRALLRTSRQLLEQSGRAVSTSFRAAGNLGTPKMLRAACSEGYAVDSSAIDFRQLEDKFQADRVHELWPDVQRNTQPFALELPACELVELPVAALADFASADDIVRLVQAARTRLAAEPERDVVMVLGLQQETAVVAPRVLGDAFVKLRSDPAINDVLGLQTIEQAASRSRRHSL